MNTSENDCQDLAATGLKPSLELRHLFATPCPEVLTMIALFKTWLSKSWILSGQRISTLDPCQELCLSWLGLPRREHKWTWLSRLGSKTVLKSYIFLRSNIPCLECYIFWQLHAPKSWQWLHRYSRLGLTSLETFWGKESTFDPCQELCLSWLGLPRRDHKWTWLSRLGSHRSEILHFSLLQFCNSMSSSFDKDCTIQDLAFQVLKLFAV